jgi:diadenosine tetraphosphate (Ap4A) HIT family hydrolase
VGSNRSRRGELSYRKYQAKQPPGCDFCKIEKGHDQYLDETPSFLVIKNRFPYAVWDLQLVEKHLMVIPKKHLGSLSQLTPEQAVEYLQLIGLYEVQGYHVYSRGVNTLTRTVAHQHTHLIKGKGAQKWLVMHVAKPHLLVSR